MANKIRLTRGGQDILGSDGFLYTDARLSIASIKEFVMARNYRLKKNFPHKVCDGFYFVNDRFERVSKDFKIINPFKIYKTC